MVFLRNHRFPLAEDILNQLYQRRVKGIDPRVDMQTLLNFSTDDGHVAKYGNASRAVDTVSRDYPDAGLAGSLTPTK